ncbi:MAG: hypothetical protein B7733_09925 [Myxococcales bacterium FL481]|nr:MAG: hypothetical protein B7733_09925 [Myxococcales bacterium FL481]
MLPWKRLDADQAPDGEVISLHQRGEEFLIRAGGRDLMSSRDDASSRALATLGCAALPQRDAVRVLVGGLGLGYTLRAALDAVGDGAEVHVAELAPCVVRWNRGPLAHLAGRPLEDRRVSVHEGDVRQVISRGPWDAILLDVDNGPDPLTHDNNEALYSRRGVEQAYRALSPHGVVGVWSFSDDPGFTRRLQRQGFEAHVERVSASRTGRGRYHYIWVARRPSRV